MVQAIRFAEKSHFLKCRWPTLVEKHDFRKGKRSSGHNDITISAYNVVNVNWPPPNSPPNPRWYHQRSGILGLLQKPIKKATNILDNTFVWKFVYHSYDLWPFISANLLKFRKMLGKVKKVVVVMYWPNTAVDLHFIHKVLKNLNILQFKQIEFEFSITGKLKFDLNPLRGEFFYVVNQPTKKNIEN